MNQNKFVWADLSSYQPQKIRSFYETVFDWSYYDMYGYLTAYIGNTAITGLYETPLKFQEMKMPSFWMSYIQVESVKETVEKAKKNGGIIELIDLDNPIGGVALIRDNQGAGFTVYEGNYMDARTVDEENTLIFNELQVSDIAKAVSFYKEVFAWDFVWLNDTSVAVHCKVTKEKLANIEEVSDLFKGKYQYWACIFGVGNSKETLTKIKKYGGTVVYDEGNRAMCSDGSEAFFYIQQV
jgi:hypothetical protein